MYSQRIKEIRSYYGLSVAKMADKLEMSSSTLTSYETNKRTPSIEFCTRLYNILNINLNWFITGSGSMLIPPKYENIKDDILAEVEKLLKNKGL